MSRSLDRRSVLKRSLAFLGSGLVLGAARRVSAQSPPGRPPSMTAPGAGMSGYGTPSPFESRVTRTLIRSQPGTTGSGGSRTPLESLDGTITPSGLHFERHHSGVPEVDPAHHRLLIHGRVTRPLTFAIDDLLRYPMTTRAVFIECAGNSQLMYGATPADLTCGQIHGLVSCTEWTGVPVRILLDEAGADPAAEWALAEGADAAAMSRSIPMAKLMDDALLALYQNGERLRPENGYPVRLVLPGYEGNMNVKWLRRLKVTSTPTMTKDETSKYTDLQADGTSLMFTYPMDVKSAITRPSPGVTLRGAGVYEISGLAWSGNGAIRHVDVSTDGGRTWTRAALAGPVLPKALTRFRVPWTWDGNAALVQSRATDESGAVQPTRERLIAEHGANVIFHYNAIQTWRVAANGEVKNVYA